MNNDFKKVIVGSIVVFFLSISFIPKNAEAALIVDLPYGGFNVFSVPCVCSVGVVWYTWFWPLLPYLPVTGGPMAVGVPPLSLWYLYFDPIIPTTWSLGRFIPIAQTCWQPGLTGCNPWPVVGHSFMVGSSLPAILAPVAGN